MLRRSASASLASLRSACASERRAVPATWFARCSSRWTQRISRPPAKRHSMKWPVTWPVSSLFPVRSPDIRTYGHTDSTGSDTYNQSLSERRAKTVARYLEGKGIAVGRLTTSGAGESKPIADNATKEGRAKNRRVVLSRTHLEVQVLYTPDTGICARSARPCASNRSTIRPAGEVGSLLS